MRRHLILSGVDRAGRAGQETETAQGVESMSGPSARSLVLQASLVAPSQGELVEWEDWWTGGYIFENEWHNFRTRQDRELELKTVAHTYAQPGRCQMAVKVIDIFGNDTMTIVPVSVG
jgi:hypothetical protein